MRAKIHAEMLHKIENAVYSAWVEELQLRDVAAVEAHRQATAALERRMQLLKEAWLTVDWLPEDTPSQAPATVDGIPEDQIRRFAHLIKYGRPL